MTNPDGLRAFTAAEVRIDAAGIRERWRSQTFTVGQSNPRFDRDSRIAEMLDAYAALLDARALAPPPSADLRTAICAALSGGTLCFSAEQVERIMAAIAPLLTAAGGAWQPIATAPKDGTRVLLGNQFERGVGCWVKSRQDWVDDGGNFMRSTGMPITHWMPLPSAPTDGAR